MLTEKGVTSYDSLDDQTVLTVQKEEEYSKRKRSRHFSSFNVALDEDINAKQGVNNLPSRTFFLRANIHHQTVWVACIIGMSTVLSGASSGYMRTVSSRLLVLAPYFLASYLSLIIKSSDRGRKRISTHHIQRVLTGQDTLESIEDEESGNNDKPIVIRSELQSRQGKKSYCSSDREICRVTVDMVGGIVMTAAATGLAIGMRLLMPTKGLFMSPGACASNTFISTVKSSMTLQYWRYGYYQLPAIIMDMIGASMYLSQVEDFQLGNAIFVGILLGMIHPALQSLWRMPIVAASHEERPGQEWMAINNLTFPNNTELSLSSMQVLLNLNGEGGNCLLEDSIHKNYPSGHWARAFGPMIYTVNTLYYMDRVNHPVIFMANAVMLAGETAGYLWTGGLSYASTCHSLDAAVGGSMVTAGIATALVTTTVIASNLTCVQTAATYVKGLFSGVCSYFSSCASSSSEQINQQHLERLANEDIGNRDNPYHPVF